MGLWQPGHLVVAMTGDQACPAEQVCSEQGRGTCEAGKSSSAVGPARSVWAGPGAGLSGTLGVLSDIK